MQAEGGADLEKEGKQIVSDDHLQCAKPDAIARSNPGLRIPLSS
jgi:hypothetical protein